MNVNLDRCKVFSSITQLSNKRYSGTILFQCSTEKGLDSIGNVREGRSIKQHFRCLYRRCLPLPIPNRAVKPARADGTAVTGGRVGRCRILYQAPSENWRGFFVCLLCIELVVFC